MKAVHLAPLVLKCITQPAACCACSTCHAPAQDAVPLPLPASCSVADPSLLQVIYIAPLKALVRERIKDWGQGFCRILGKRMVELTGDYTPDMVRAAVQCTALCLAVLGKGMVGVIWEVTRPAMVRAAALYCIVRLHARRGEPSGCIQCLQMYVAGWPAWHALLPLRPCVFARSQHALLAVAAAAAAGMALCFRCYRRTPAQLLIHAIAPHPIHQPQHALLAADVIVCTPEKWDGISRNWQSRSYVRKASVLFLSNVWPAVESQAVLGRSSISFRPQLHASA